MYETHRRWWSVADAARLLRVHTDTLYDACASGDFPHERSGGLIRIPCEALKMRYVPDAETLAISRRMDVATDFDQLELDLDPACLVPVKRYRNTRELVGAWDYERQKYAQKVPRKPVEARG